MLVNKEKPSPLQEIRSKLLSAKKIKLFIKRDDLIHPEISGNKWRKLKYNLEAAKAQQQDTLLTFGGAFSNHIYALAAAGKIFGFKTIGIIRGEKIRPINPTLSFAEQSGMDLHFIPRSEYKERATPVYFQKLRKKFGDFYLIPEGGTNVLAVKGCTEIVKEVEGQLNYLPDFWATACGTGGTLGGIIVGLEGKKKALGFSVLKGDFHQKEVNILLKKYYSNSPSILNNWTIHPNYHFGGYAKFKPPLIDFINNFKKSFAVQLDPIYTGKLLFGIFDLIEKDYFPVGSSLVVLHSGGLQGIKGFNKRYNQLIR